MDDRRSTYLRLAVAALAAIAFAAVAWTYLARSDERFIAQLEDPTSARLARATHRAFPDHFDDFRRVFEDPSLDGAARDQAALKVGRAITRANHGYLAYASDRALFDWIKGFRDLAAANDGLPPQVCDPGTDKLLDNFSVAPSLFEAYAQAVVEGRDRPFQRPPATEADFALLETALNSPEMVETLRRYRAGDYGWMTPQQRCGFMGAWFDALTRMPEDRATRLFVDIEF